MADFARFQHNVLICNLHVVLATIVILWSYVFLIFCFLLSYRYRLKQFLNPGKLHASSRGKTEGMSHILLDWVVRARSNREGVKKDRKSTRLNSSHITRSRMPSSA
eukprot:TRINITY_DN13_c0_g1_i8.p4 TRINITY_DN13_c0_g1~~TRINITY_DN13_c0_g1_i8.p4  ORF type:complete len:106 (+),score=1.97 TRINITY_DN13_c0_g1_i8:705-1022(+)